MAKKSIIALALTCASNLYAASTPDFECSPEISGGDEVVSLFLDYDRSVAVVKVGEKVLEECNEVKFSEKGDILEYGEGAVLTIKCKKGKAVTVSRDYDELVLDVSALKHADLSDERYMCN